MTATDTARTTTIKNNTRKPVVNDTTTARPTTIKKRSTSKTTKETRYIHDDDMDMQYCKEIARRAVARAALHMGVEEMSGDALCVLGDILISYLEKIGKVMAATVEESKRTSAHCNVFDALYAVEVCTPATAYQLHLCDKSDTIINNDYTTNNQKKQQAPWEKLASFLFGDNWCDDSNFLQQPPPLNNEKDNINDKGNLGNNGGWNVPHYDTIEPFPTCRRSRQKQVFFHELGKVEEACRDDSHKQIGKPQLNTKKTDSASTNTPTPLWMSKAKKAEQNAANEIPESHYRNGITSFWGTFTSGRKENFNGVEVDGSHTNDLMDTEPTGEVVTEGSTTNKRKRKDENNDTKANLRKRAKTSFASDTKVEQLPTISGTRKRPLYVPQFFPAFPPEHTYVPSILSSHNSQSFTKEVSSITGPNTTTPSSTSISNTNTTSTTTDIVNPLYYNETEAKSVRESLVTLGKTVGTFWGSMPIIRHENNNNKPAIQVQTGAITDEPNNENSSKNSATVVAPLERASTLKISRILEGSYDSQY